MDGKVLICSIRLRSFLSFGPDSQETELVPLNVLIGPNGSGKSNFIEAVRFLHMLPKGIRDYVDQSGKVEQFIWKGDQEQKIAHIQAEVIYDQPAIVIGYSISFNEENGVFNVFDEVLSNVDEVSNPSLPKFFYWRAKGKHYVSTFEGSERLISAIWQDSALLVNNLQFDSVLGTITDEARFPVIGYVSRTLSSIEVFAEGNMGRTTIIRKPQVISSNTQFINEDASNIAVIINDLKARPGAMHPIIEKMRLFYPMLENIHTKVSQEGIQIYLEERGLAQSIPATRLSDGTLRFLFLCAILNHPSPPPLMCLEEPELGMHPDIIPTIAELLIEASQRTQLIVTTHSDRLVSAIGEKHPEAILVCDRTRKGTTLTRLEPEKLTEWLKDYSLGEVWLKGAIGGTRW